jgi:hypothetical protein
MPRWVTTLRLRLRSLFFKAEVERELDEELQYHFEREVEERRAAGLPEQEARLSRHVEVWEPSGRTWRRVATCVAST